MLTAVLLGVVYAECRKNPLRLNVIMVSVVAPFQLHAFCILRFAFCVLRFATKLGKFGGNAVVKFKNI
jgi:hypothetical protein